MIHNSARKQLPALSNPGVASDLRGGKQLVGADGSVVTGTLAEVAQATPSIAVSSGGLITASATQSGGIVTAGTKSATRQLTTQGAKTVTPTTTNQTAVSSGRYVTGNVVVAGDENLVPENIAEGVSIFGVSGTHKGGADTVTGTLVVPSSSSVGGMSVKWIDDYGVHETLCERGSSVTITPFSNSFIYGPTATIASGDAEKQISTGFQTGLCYVYGDFTLTSSI